jgi:hypothetical protein
VRRPSERIPWSQRGDLRWFYYGELARADDGSLAVASLAVHPWPNAYGAGFRGVTRELLRAISPTAIVEAAAELRIVHRVSEDQYRIEPVAEGVPRRGRRPSVDDNRMRAYALQYLARLEEGVGRGIHAKLASDFALPGGAAESREWARRARKRKFLTATDQGRAGANPGPRLMGEVPTTEGGKSDG